MSEISDELRKEAAAVKDYRVSFASERILKLADRIDAEMVELPRDANGKPIHFGDTVFTNDDPGTSWCVRYIELRCDREPSIGIESSGVNTYRPPSYLTHECPDSWDRIANELDEWRFEHMRGIEADDLNDLCLFADRIRRLAERETGDE